MFRFLITLGVLTSLLLGSIPASASLGDYTFEVSSGSASDMSSATSLWRGYAGSRYASDVNDIVAGVSLPFTFRFDGADYTRISVSSNGLIGFGSNDVTSGNDNSFGNAGSYPAITAWWDQLTLTGGSQNNCSASPSVSWSVSGRSPSQVMTIEWRDVEVAWRTGAYSTFQVRLYEGSNAIELVYPNMTSVPCMWWSSQDWNWTSATIGLAGSNGEVMSVIPQYGDAYVTRDGSYDWVDLSQDQFRIPSNTIYRFVPCNISLAGDTRQGGTDRMVDGDVLLSGLSVQRGSSGGFQPFTIENLMGGCGPRNFRLEISGAAAAEYGLDVSEGTLDPGSSIVPTITFSPNGPGVRTATLTITDDNYFSRTFTLAATADPRIEWIASIADGATPGIADGDTLMASIEVRRRTPRDLQPISLRNYNDNPEATAAHVSVSIDSAGSPSTQYELVGPTSVELTAGETFAPVIRFTGEGVGPQTATLTIVADDETRTYTLRAVSAAAAIAVTANAVAVDKEIPALNLASMCVGESLTVPFTVTNFGVLPLSVERIAVYQTDTTTRQGTPLFPLLRGAQGAPIELRDYVISATAGGAPIAVPFTVDRGVTRRLYLTYIGAEPGKRFGRIFLRTNAENLYGTDTTVAADEVLGMFTTDVTARAVGSQLAADARGVALRPIVFPHTRVGDSATISFTVANTGACDLRINRSKLRIQSGDVSEFRMLASLRNARIDQARGDYVLGVGMIDTITVRFLPSRAGTRMATLRLQTNDSTIMRPGLAERGAFYLDLHGRGLAGLDGADVTLAPVVIGGSVEATAVLENTLNVAVGVDRAYFDGGDAAEFAAVGWPSMPTIVLPAQKLRLGIRLTPVGEAGTRRTTLVLVTGSGDTVRLAVRGEAGTQTLVVSPSSLFDGVALAIGQTRRQTLRIATTGTLPVRITDVQLRGVDAASYRMGVLPRRDLEAGQTEYLEMTFAPTAIGATNAELVVTASNGQTYTVLLGGEAVRILREPVDPPTTSAPGSYGTPGQRRDDAGVKRPTLR